MADVEFNQENIEGLARKLSALDHLLSEKERELLIAIFAAAVGRTEVPVPSEGRGTLPGTEINQPQGPGPGGRETLSELQRQLLNSYIPGNAPDHPNQGFSDRISGG
jgi:hypothetical protein